MKFVNMKIAKYFWDGEEDPRYEYDMQGVVIGKDGKPKRKK